MGLVANPLIKNINIYDVGLWNLRKQSDAVGIRMVRNDFNGCLVGAGDCRDCFSGKVAYSAIQQF